MARRPNPRRSGYPGCAPRVTPERTARATVRSMTAGSPAWKPQATLAEVTRARRSASEPMAQAPNPSPTSALRSMRGNGGPRLAGDDLHLPSDLAARELRGVHVAVGRACTHVREELRVGHPHHVGGLEAALVELTVDAAKGIAGRIGSRAREQRDTDGAVDAGRGLGAAAVDVRSDDRGREVVDLDAVVHAVAAHVEAHVPRGRSRARRHLVGTLQHHHELLADVVGCLVARHERETQDGARHADPRLTTHAHLHHRDAPGDGPFPIAGLDSDSTTAFPGRAGDPGHCESDGAGMRRGPHPYQGQEASMTLVAL